MTRAILVALLFGCTIGGCSESNSKSKEAPLAKGTEAVRDAASVPPTAASQVTPRVKLQRYIDGLVAQIDLAPTRWGSRLQVAQAYLQQAVLTGSLQPYADAILHLEAARTMPGYDTLVVPLTLAEAYLALHENTKAREMLDAIPERFRDAANYLRIDGQLKVARGDVAGAKINFQAMAARADASPRGRALLGHLADLQNDHEEALVQYATAIDLSVDRHAALKPWVLVLRGLSYMHRGQFARAQDDFEKAVTIAPHSILALEHLAEIQGRTGQLELAAASYQEVLALTRNPEFLDAFAGIEEQRGNSAEAKALIAEAKTGYNTMLETFPKAAYGHAIDFYLGAGDDAKLALDLASKDSELRPNGTSYLQLAQAYLANEQFEPARTALAQAMTFATRSAELYWTVAAVHQGLGETEKAEAARSMALQINPKQSEM